MNTVTIGFNENTQYFTIHKHNCHHVERDEYTEVFDIQATSVKELVDACYGSDRGSYYAEAGCTDQDGWIAYGGLDALRIAPCAKELMKGVK